MPALRVSVVQTFDERFVTEWKNFLDERASERHLEHEPTFSKAEHVLHPDRPPYIVVARRDGRIVALAVCTRFRAPLHLNVSVVRIRKISAWTLKVFGNEFAYDRDEDPEELARALFEGLARREDEIGVLMFYELLESSVIWKLFRGGTARVAGFSLEPTSNQAEAVHLAGLPETLEALLARIPSDKRTRVRRVFRSAGAKSFEIQEFRTPDEVPAFSQHLKELYERTWQSRTFGARPRNDEHLKMLAAQGWFRSFVLFDQGKAIAFVLGFQYNGTYIYEEPGYDLATADKSPGYTLLCLLIERLYREDRPTRLDFGFGDNQYKRVFSTETLPVRSVVAVHLLRYRMLFRGQRAVTTVYERVRKEAIDRGYDTRIRNWLKRRT